ncbi:MAG: hypothetical protein ACK5EU_04500 [Pseudanabaena sp.]|jgi:hypothetical protein|uniref:hypothetical protein n=1 Tax=Pseudanabaena mucicola TaxID=71190 RepID=UPI00257553EE|nr:hypothetical protein [Pseudanabaena mucicola]MCA6598408.1 hypothetical protein [Pseudanabaena sp. M046S1SP1A06QC]MCE2977951.1 hypothetical protein [Pseudanabaena sp. CoA8_M7]
MGYGKTSNKKTCSTASIYAKKGALHLINAPYKIGDRTFPRFPIIKKRAFRPKKVNKDNLNS